MATLLADLTFPEAEALRARDPVILLPIGATEAHGPHLPLGTDVIISEALAGRAADALEQRGLCAAIAPSLAYSVTECAADFAGTISIPARTAVALVRSICRDLHLQRFRRVCLVSSHLEAAHVTALQEAVSAVTESDGLPVAFPNVLDRRWARTLSDEFKRGACHAGAYETSLVLAARPELVRQAVRAALPPLDIDLPAALRAGAGTFREAGGADAYFGDPAAATAQHGDQLYALLVTMVVTVVDETWPELKAPP